MSALVVVVVSFLCLCSPVKMVYSLFKFFLFVRSLHGRPNIGYNSFIPATSLPQYTPSGRIGAPGCILFSIVWLDIKHINFK